MNKLVVTGFLAIASMFAGSAMAGEILEDGLYTMSNSYKGNSIVIPFTVKLVDKIDFNGEKEGVYEFGYGDNNVYAASSKAGTEVVTDSPKKTRWWGHYNGTKSSGGWSFHPIDNKANCISFNYDGKRKLKLRRSNAGGRGNKDQIWKATKK